MKKCGDEEGSTSSGGTSATVPSGGEELTIASKGLSNLWLATMVAAIVSWLFSDDVSRPSAGRSSSCTVNNGALSFFASTVEFDPILNAHVC